MTASVSVVLPWGCARDPQDSPRHKLCRCLHNPSPEFLRQDLCLWALNGQIKPHAHICSNCSLLHHLPGILWVLEQNVNQSQLIEDRDREAESPEGGVGPEEGAVRLDNRKRVLGLLTNEKGVLPWSSSRESPRRRALRGSLSGRCRSCPQPGSRWGPWPMQVSIRSTDQSQSDIQVTWPVLTNHRQIFTSRDLCRPIRGQYHLVHEDADEHQQHRDSVRPPEEAGSSSVHHLKCCALIGWPQWTLCSYWLVSVNAGIDC